MKAILHWIRCWWKCGIALAIGFCLAVDIIGMIRGEAPDWPVWLILIGITLILMWMDKRLTAVVLALALVTSAPAQEKLLAWIIAGIAVLGGGTYITVRVIKKCNRIARQRTNAWPEDMFAPAGNTYGATWSWTEEGYCSEDRLMDLQPSVVTTLQLHVTSRTNAALTVSANMGEQYSQTYDEFIQEMNGVGLTFALTPNMETSYSLNGLPCEEDLLPISFESGTMSLCIGPGNVGISIMRSNDMVNWKPFLRLRATMNDRIEIQDATSTGMAFYKVEVEQ